MLACPPVAVTGLDMEKVPWRLREVCISQAYAKDVENVLSVAEQAATLFPRTWRVRIEGKAQVGMRVRWCTVHGFAVPIGLKQELGHQIH